MKKSNLLLIIIAAIALPIRAQEAQGESETEKKDWNFSGLVGLNASATGLVHWAAGGNNSVTGVAFTKLRLVYDKNSIGWESNLDLEYGLSYIDQKFDAFQKSSDHIKFDTKVGWEFKEHWYLSALFSFQSQFSISKKYSGTEEPSPITSNWLAPSYTDLSLGIDWKPNNIFSVYLSPVSGRISTAYISDRVQDNHRNFDFATYNGDYNLRRTLQENYGIWKYKELSDGMFEKEYFNSKAEFGLTFKGSINYTYKDLKIISNLKLFTPYAWDKTKLYSATDADGNVAIYTEAGLEKKGYTKDAENVTYAGHKDNNKRFGNFDVDWDLAISYQFLKCLNVTFSGNLKYYNGVNIPNKHGEHPCERVQLMGVLGIGVGYSF